MPPRQDFVVARRRHADKWDAFFALKPKDILLVVKDGKPVLSTRKLGAEFHRVGGKYVRLPVPEMIEEVGRYIDPEALISRFTA